MLIQPPTMTIDVSASDLFSRQILANQRWYSRFTVSDATDIGNCNYVIMMMKIWSSLGWDTMDVGYFFRI